MGDGAVDGRTLCARSRRGTKRTCHKRSTRSSGWLRSYHATVLSPIPSAHRRLTNGDRDPAPLTAARAPHVRRHCQPPRPAAPQHRRRWRECPWPSAERRAFISCTSGRRLLFRLTAVTAITAAAAAARQTCAALARARACPTSPAGWPPRCRRPSRCCTACTASTRNRMPDGAQRPLKHTADWSRSAHADAKRTFDGSRTTPEATCENLHLAPKLRKRARAACSRRIDMWSKGRAHRQWPAWEYSKHSGPATDAALVQKESERRRSCAIDGARRGRCRSGRAREYCAVGGWAGGKERVRGFHAAEFCREEARTRRVGDVVVVIDDGSSGAVCGRVPPTCGSGCSECAVPH